MNQVNEFWWEFDMTELNKFDMIFVSFEWIYMIIISWFKLNLNDLFFKDKGRIICEERVKS